MEEEIETKIGHDFLIYLYQIIDKQGFGYIEVCKMARQKFVEMFGIEKPEVLSFISHFAEIMKRHSELDYEYTKLAKQIENKEKIFLVQQPYWLF
ncbi:MAG: hypothetical protein J6K71_02385 [Clostridia bacterium]|nr:hypothetical protein [Clostridia bacterium]